MKRATKKARTQPLLASVDGAALKVARRGRRNYPPNNAPRLLALQRRLVIAKRNKFWLHIGVFPMSGEAKEEFSSVGMNRAES